MSWELVCNPYASLQLKNGDHSDDVTDRNKATPGAIVTLYPWTFCTGSCRYYYFSN
jgi:hypothetical protein